ncbi:hypothetical protein BGZ76_000667 [Entomortierella beljakovae]|nr:hypothetical protein BGZ76_000667 [Entomortierella beljakovae]
MNYNSVLGPLAPQSEASYIVDDYPAAGFTQIKSLMPNHNISPIEPCQMSPRISPTSQMPPPNMPSDNDQEHRTSTNNNVVQTPLNLPPAQDKQKNATNLRVDATVQSIPKEKRRWTLTGRLFEKRRSSTGSPDIPNTLPQNLNNNSSSSNKVPAQSASSGRRTSLADIPKALLSSLRRSSLTSSSEPKDKSNQSTQPSSSSIVTTNTQDKADGGAFMATNDNATEATPTMAIMTTEIPHQATVEAPNELPSETGHAQNLSTEEIHKQHSTNDTSPSSLRQINENVQLHEFTDRNLDTPSGHQSHTLTESSVSTSTPQSQSEQERQVDLRSQEEEEAIATNDGVSEIDNTPRFKPPVIDQEISPFDNTEVPPHVIPGMQSNAHGDRAERPQGIVTDPYIGVDEAMGFNTSYLNQSHQNHDPFAMSGIAIHQVPDVSARYSSSSDTEQSHSQRSSLSSQGSDDMMYEPFEGDVESYEDDHMYADEVAMPIRVFSSSIGRLPKSAISSNNGYNNEGRRKSISFTDTIEVIPVHRKSEYNRRSDRNATFRILTPDLKVHIREELNNYKLREMAVHVRSMSNTAFH